MTLQPGKQTITIHILPNISRNEASIQWNMVNYIFLQKSCEKEQGG